jgi:hypothetical protein
VGEVLSKHDAAAPGVRFGLAVAWASEGVSEVERERIDQVAAAARLDATRVSELAAEMRG